MRRSVTVGITAYNEEQNIAKLLNSLAAQKISGFKLDKVLVISDGSTDNTVAEVMNVKFMKKNQINIEIIDDGKRIGQPRRFMQLIADSESEYLVFFDADTLIADELTLNNLVKELKFDKIAITSARISAINRKNYLEKLIINWLSVWECVCNLFLNGNNIYNVHGTGLAIKRNLFRKVKIPNRVTSAAKYLYMYAMLNNYKFKYVSRSNVLYRVPSNFKDYYYQLNRNGSERKIFERSFGILYYKYGRVGIKIKLKGIYQATLKFPIKSFSGVLFSSISSLFVTERTFSKSGVWKISNSTKTTINL